MNPPHRKYPLPPLRVLVVDADPEARASLRGLLRVWGNEVCEAPSPGEALRLAADFRPDLVMVDVTIIDRDGPEFGARLRELPGLERLAVVTLEGDSCEDASPPADEAGGYYHLPKPTAPILLRRLLGSIRHAEWFMDS